MTLDVDVRYSGRTAHLAITGDLEHETCDSLVDLVTHILNDRPNLGDLHLDFTNLTSCDSAALAAILLIHRRTDHVHVTLHLDQRPDFLNHTLDLTGTRDHLISTPAATGEGEVVAAEHRSL